MDEKSMKRVIKQGREGEILKIKVKKTSFIEVLDVTVIKQKLNVLWDETLGEWLQQSPWEFMCSGCQFL